MNHIPGNPSWINGTVGVDIFFALSGWLITWLLLQEYKTNRTIILSSFYIRRAFRILPLYFATVALYFILVALGMKKSGSSELHAALPYMLSLNMEFKPIEAGSLFGHAWTLGIEEKFYIAWPLILAANIRRPWVAVLIAFFGLAVLIAALGGGDNTIRGYAGLGGGATLAVLVYRYPELAGWLSRRAVADSLILPLGALYAGSLLLYPHHYVWNVAIGLLAAPLVASLWFNASQKTGALLAWPPLAWLGRLTFAIYLIQSIAIQMAEVILAKFHVQWSGLMLFPFVYALCVALAWLAHVAIEKPMIHQGKALAKLTMLKLRGLQSAGASIP